MPICKWVVYAGVALAGRSTERRHMFRVVSHVLHRTDLQIGLRRVRSPRRPSRIAAFTRVGDRSDIEPPTERARCACGALVDIPYQAWIGPQRAANA